MVIFFPLSAWKPSNTPKAEVSNLTSVTVSFQESKSQNNDKCVAATTCVLSFNISSSIIDLSLGCTKNSWPKKSCPTKSKKKQWREIHCFPFTISCNRKGCQAGVSEWVSWKARDQLSDFVSTFEGWCRQKSNPSPVPYFILEKKQKNKTKQKKKTGIAGKADVRRQQQRISKPVIWQT